MHQAVAELAPVTGGAEACRILEVSRASYYRAQSERSAPEPTSSAGAAPPDRRSVRALSADERARVRDVLTSERFVDCAPREVYATLLDEGIYLCSWPTMYRILREAHEVRRRRDQQ